MPARYQQLETWIKENGWVAGAELGLFDGRTFLYLLDRCQSLVLIGVDVWDPSFKEGATKSGERCHCQYCGETRASRKVRSLEEHGRFVVKQAVTYDGRAIVKKMTTRDASLEVRDGSLDFVFVDADHSFEGVSTDIVCWLPKIRPDGVLAGHDYNMKSVRDAVRAQCGSRAVTESDDHVWRVRC